MHNSHWFSILRFAQVFQSVSARFILVMLMANHLTSHVIYLMDQNFTSAMKRHWLLVLVILYVSRNVNVQLVMNPALPKLNVKVRTVFVWGLSALKWHFCIINAFFLTFDIFICSITLSLFYNCSIIILLLYHYSTNILPLFYHYYAVTHIFWSVPNWNDLLLADAIFSLILYIRQKTIETILHFRCWWVSTRRNWLL